MDRYHIRAAKIEDVPQIALVAKESWHHTYGPIYPKDVIEQFVSRAYSSENLTGSIRRDETQPFRLFHVAIDAYGHVAGFAHVVPMPDNDSTFELVRIYSLPQSHGTGVGASLLRHLLENVPTLRELAAWVEQDNHIGRAFYERHGFAVVEEKEDDFYGHKTRLLRYCLRR